MSHQVTITRTTTTSSTTAVLVNTGYAKTIPGILKLIQVIIGAVCVGLVAYYFSWRGQAYELYVPELYFLLIATTCLITTACLLFSCLLSIATASILPKTLFESFYHSVAFVLYIAAAICLLTQTINYKRSLWKAYYDSLIAASVLGLINSALYLVSLIFAVRQYRIA